MEKRRLPQNANALTAALILAIPKEVKGARVWRMNVGGAYPIQAIQMLKNAIMRGDLQESLSVLNRTRPLMFGGLPGLPDICGILPDGRWLGIEVKWGRDQQREDQKVCQRVFEERGAVYVIARDLDAAVREVVVRVNTIHKD